MRRELLWGPLALLLLWCIAHYSGLVSPLFLPGPLTVLKAIVVGFGDFSLLYDLAVTLARFAAGFITAAVAGVVAGILLGYYQKAYAAVEVVLDFFRSVPATALFPLFMLFFGVGNVAKVMVVFFACSLIILVNTAYGVRNASSLRVMLGRSLKASEIQILVKLILPDSLPHICAGLRVGISFALILVVVTEMFLGTVSGLGHRIIEAQLVYKIPDMYAAIIIAGLIGYALNNGFVKIERRLVHWSGR